MKLNHLILFAAFFGFSFTANASVMIIETDTFRCSDGRNYDVVRHFIGGWGPGNWKLVALCNDGILTKRNYEGRFLNPRESHRDIGYCIDEDTPAVRRCALEFVNLNGSRGTNLTPIIHGRKKSYHQESPNSNYVPKDNSGWPNPTRSPQINSGWPNSNPAPVYTPTPVAR